MDNFVVLNMIFLIAIAFMLMAFAVFAMGFLIGYKMEDKRSSKRKQGADNNKYEESDQEKKAKKEWKKFLEYDGSAPDGVEI